MDNIESITSFQAYEAGLNQLIEFQNGDTTKAKIIVFSMPIPKYDKEKISNLRKQLRLSQKGLSNLIGVSCRTVESWEIGRSTPKGPVSRLLYLIEKDNTLMDKLVIKEEVRPDN